MASSSVRDIRNLFIVLGGGIVCAIIAAVLLIYVYIPTGRYYARNVLLNPELTAQLSYMDLNPKTGGSSQFIYDRVEYHYFDPAIKRWQQVTVPQETYRQFYDLVADDRSLASVTPEVVSLFNAQSLPRLVIQVKTKSDSEWQLATKTFIEVQFHPGSEYYRIQLRSDSLAEGWAYFKHVRLLDELQPLFIRL